MATGIDLLRLAETRIGEKYENILVPKDNPNWHGPWDCAEFASWVVYQNTRNLYGTFNNNGNPATADSYSGQWAEDVKTGRLQGTDKQTANNTPGIILIRKPPMSMKIGRV